MIDDSIGHDTIRERIGDSFVLNLAPEDGNVAPSIVIARNRIPEFGAAE